MKQRARYKKQEHPPIEYKALTALDFVWQVY